MYVNLLKSAVAKLPKSARSLTTSIATEGRIEKSVFISQSNDVYTNLALEEWLHKNEDFKNHRLMLFYKNDPCIVLGKNDNPWSHQEAGQIKDVSLARRQTDAQTQYQDGGAVNLTFFGENLDRDYNLGVISRGIFRKYGLTLRQQDDHLTYYNMKLSDTTSEMCHQDSNAAYQNCSIFVDVNKNNLETASNNDNKATTMGNYLNLSEVDPKINTEGLLSAIGWEYLRTKPFALKDGGENLAFQQRGFQMINPSEDWFPGITEIKEKLMHWDWCYGKTPTFTIYRTFPVPKELLNNSQADSNELRVKLEVANGKIHDISLVVPPGLLSSGFTGEAKIVTEIRGQRFTEKALQNIERFLGLKSVHNEREKFVTECVKKAMVV